MNTSRIVIAALLLAHTGLMSSSAAQGVGLWDSAEAIKVKTTAIQIKDKVKITVETPGRLTLLEPSSVGGVVNAGAVVAKLDTRLAEAQLEELELEAAGTVLIDFARIKLKNAEFELQDKKDKNKKSGRKVFSDAELRRLELEVEQSSAGLKKEEREKKIREQKVKTKQVELDMHTSRAGFSGIVMDMHNISVGAAVRQGDPIMTIVNLNQVEAIMEVSEAEYERIQLGDTVLIRRRVGQQSEAVDEGGLDTYFDKTTRQQPETQSGTSTSTKAMATEEAETLTFTGKVKHFANKALKNGKYDVVAVIDNKLAGEGKYYLVESTLVDARIIPSN